MLSVILQDKAGNSIGQSRGNNTSTMKEEKNRFLKRTFKTKSID